MPLSVEYPLPPWELVKRPAERAVEGGVEGGCWGPGSEICVDFGRLSFLISAELFQKRLTLEGRSSWLGWGRVFGEGRFRRYCRLRHHSAFM